MSHSYSKAWLDLKARFPCPTPHTDPWPSCSFCPWPPMTARGALTATPKLSHPDIDPSSPTAAFPEYQSTPDAPKALHGALLPPGPGDLLSSPGHSSTVTRSHARSTAWPWLSPAPAHSRPSLLSHSVTFPSFLSCHFLRGVTPTSLCSWPTPLALRTLSPCTEHLLTHQPTYSVTVLIITSSSQSASSTRRGSCVLLTDPHCLQWCLGLRSSAHIWWRLILNNSVFSSFPFANPAFWPK